MSLGLKGLKVHLPLPEMHKYHVHEGGTKRSLMFLLPQWI